MAPKVVLLALLTGRLCWICDLLGRQTFLCSFPILTLSQFTTIRHISIRSIGRYTRFIRVKFNVGWSYGIV